MWWELCPLGSLSRLVHQSGAGQSRRRARCPLLVPSELEAEHVYPFDLVRAANVAALLPEWPMNGMSRASIGCCNAAHSNYLIVAQVVSP